jgi:two-component system response regulator TctD
MIEDDAALARSIAALLRAGGHAVDHVATGEDALAVVGGEPYARVILDVGLPDIDGFTVLAELRRRGEKVPVLMLTARDALDDRVRGLDLGADDYLRKPFEPQELEARVRALGRRRGGGLAVGGVRPGAQRRGVRRPSPRLQRGPGPESLPVLRASGP